VKILILGLGKSGTTALLFKIAAGLPGCRAFSGGKPGKYIGDYKHAVYKHTYEERKGKDFNLYKEHLKNEYYDRKIWIARDPRDAAVSKMLYRWHLGYVGHKEQYQAHLDLVRRKERDPGSIPFYEICRYTGRDVWPIEKEEIVEEELIRYQRMYDFVNDLGSEWFLFNYEDMVSKRFDALNNYLGFMVGEDTEVPKSTGKAKVVRKKASGDWRHWFTEEDVELYKSAYLPYMELTGCDCNDWRVSQSPVIEPEYSSMYMQSLPARVTRDAALKFKDRALHLFSKKAS